MPFITQGKTNLKYVLIVVILAVLVGGGILGYYYSWIKELEVKLAEIELRLSEVKPLEDETADWKSYTKTGYWGNECSIKYPDDWEVKYEESINVSYLTSKEKGIPEDIWVTINCFSKNKGYTDQTGKNLLPFCLAGKFTLSNTEKSEGIYSKEFCTLNADGSQIGTAMFQVRHGRQRMDYYIPDKEFESEFDTFDQMLSSFRFLD